MKKIPKIILSKTIGLMFFLVMLYILNRLNLNIYGYKIWVTFLNDNLALLVAMSLLFMIAEVFFALIFPFSLPAPLFSSFAALLITQFIFRIFPVIDKMITIELFSLLWPLTFLVYPIVFLAVLVGGYISIFAKMKKPKKKESKKKKSKKEKSWEEIGNGFRKAFSDFFRKLADLIDK